MHENRRTFLTYIYVRVSVTPLLGLQLYSPSLNWPISCHKIIRILKKKLDSDFKKKMSIYYLYLKLTALSWHYIEMGLENVSQFSRYTI